MKSDSIDLAFGPMSPEIIEAIFEFSDISFYPLMLIASKNQIDYDGGYVNNWNTTQYVTYINKMRDKYPDAQIKLCRDHCGPGFRTKNQFSSSDYWLDDCISTISTDIALGFDIIHIDLCHAGLRHKEQLESTKQLAEIAIGLNPNIELEIGTDENVGVAEIDLDRVEKDIQSITEVCHPTYYVVQTGSLIKETRQAGYFDDEAVGQYRNIFDNYGLKLKEHNGDYLDGVAIRARKGLVGAMNIAPQLGAVQTATVLNHCYMYGVDQTFFRHIVYTGQCWAKWELNENSSADKIIVAGHYHFTDIAYKDLINHLNKYIDINSEIRLNIQKVIEHYVHNTTD